MYEVAPSTIRRICSGVTWVEVGDRTGYNTTTYVKPPTRDLMAEARARIEAEEQRSVAGPLTAMPAGGAPRPSVSDVSSP